MTVFVDTFALIVAGVDSDSPWRSTVCGVCFVSGRLVIGDLPG
jgi:hypothetical protein